tara:strand:- start:239 stop:448 length:210 start_codon:yes stop_codon:yes gene_type:complete
MKNQNVKIVCKEGLADNIKPLAKGSLKKVSEKIISEQKYFIIENSKGIRFKVLASDCEIQKKSNKKNKK